MKTSERILQCSLDMFHQFGHVKVSAVDIAEELEISPGNLYYHYHGKDQLLAELFYEFEAAIKKYLSVYNNAEHEFEDYWSFLNIYVELLQQYSFFYRDVKLLFSEDRLLKRRFFRLVKGHQNFFSSFLSSLNDNGHITMSEEQQEVISGIIVLIATNSLDSQMTDKDVEIKQSVKIIALRIIMIIDPYFTEQSAAQFEPLKTLYTEVRH